MGYTYYDFYYEKMYANYHLNVTAKNQYFLFYRSPVGDYFPLHLSYNLGVVKKDNNKEKSTKDKVLNVINIILGLAMMIGICYCVKKFCPCCCESSGGGGTYLILRVD